MVSEKNPRSKSPRGPHIVPGELQTRMTYGSIGNHRLWGVEQVRMRLGSTLTELEGKE